MRGSIRTATDFWLMVGFLTVAGIGIYFIYGNLQEKGLKNNPQVVNKDRSKNNVEIVKDSNSKDLK